MGQHVVLHGLTPWRSKLADLANAQCFDHSWYDYCSRGDSFQTLPSYFRIHFSCKPGLQACGAQQSKAQETQAASGDWDFS